MGTRPGLDIWIQTPTSSKLKQKISIEIWPSDQISLILMETKLSANIRMRLQAIQFHYPRISEQNYIIMSWLSVILMARPQTLSIRGLAKKVCARWQLIHISHF